MRFVWASLLLSACGTGAPTTPAHSPASVAIAPAVPENAEHGAVPDTAPHDACPIVPLRLMVNSLPPASNSPTAVVRLAEDGAVTLGLGGLHGQLAPNGCLAFEGDVTVDGSSPSEIWTPYERFAIADGRMQLASGRSLEIEADGAIVTYDAAGRAESRQLLRFEGYGAKAACAARVLLAGFFASMPSMAMSDGKPKRLPPPSGSPCFANAAPAERPPR